MFSYKKKLQLQISEIYTSNFWNFLHLKHVFSFENDITPPEKYGKIYKMNTKTIKIVYPSWVPHESHMRPSCIPYVQTTKMYRCTFKCRFRWRFSSNKRKSRMCLVCIEQYRKVYTILGGRSLMPSTKAGKNIPPLVQLKPQTLRCADGDTALRFFK